MNAGPGNSAFGSSSGFGGGSTFGGSGQAAPALAAVGVWQFRSEQFRRVLAVVRTRRKLERGFGASSNSQTGSNQPGTNAAAGSDPAQDSSSRSEHRAAGSHEFRRPATVRRGTHRGRGQHQQEHDDSHIQSKEEVQRVAISIRSRIRPRRIDHDALSARA